MEPVAHRSQEVEPKDPDPRDVWPRVLVGVGRDGIGRCRKGDHVHLAAQVVEERGMGSASSCEDDRRGIIIPFGLVERSVEWISQGPFSIFLDQIVLSQRPFFGPVTEDLNAELSTTWTWRYVDVCSQAAVPNRASR